MEEKTLQSHVEDAVNGYDPPENDPGGPWRSPLWDFLREVRAHPDARDLRPRQAFERIEECLRHMGCRSSNPWAELLHVDDAEDEVLAVWKAMKHPAGELPVYRALHMGRKHPLDVPDDVMEERPARYADFLSMACWLQREAGDKNIFLPCGVVAEAMGTSEMNVSRYRKYAMEDGYLELVKPHAFRSKGKGAATEFRFNDNPTRW